MSSRSPDPEFWKRQRVLLTGHTGFKGGWLALWLERLGAEVQGFALAPDQDPALYHQLAPFPGLRSAIGDLRDGDAVRRCVEDFRPGVVLHLAAQPLVRQSYAAPADTYATNVTGTIHLLEALRGSPGLQAILVVTTDKVYANDGSGRAFVEGDRLGGHDPYSASKAAAELVVQSYAHSFFASEGVVLATARAGNVIGGGDWSADRLVPDIWRSLRAGQPLMLRYPDATRPWQHVLDPLLGYLLYVESLVGGGGGVPSALNFGPGPEDSALSVAYIADTMSRELGLPQAWRLAAGPHPPEMPALALDASLARASLGWASRLPSAAALRWTADWYRHFDAGANMRGVCLAQLSQYEEMI